MSSLTDLVDRYIDMWNETDAGRRRALIARIWTEDAHYVDPALEGEGREGIEAMVKAVREGNTLVIFPEGRITVTGALMKVFDGPGMVADKADAPIIPVRIDGAQYSPFSRLRGKVHLQRFPKISLTVLPRAALPSLARQMRGSGGPSPAADSMTR